MPIAIYWDWEGHSALKPLQSSSTETLLAPQTALRAAAHAIQIFTVFIFEYGVSIQNIRKFAPFENFSLYGNGSVLYIIHSKYKEISLIPGNSNDDQAFV